MSSPARVVIVGGGFGGLNAAKILAGRKDVEVLLLDRRNHHLFQPLLYQVAMAGLSPAEIAFPIRAVFSRKNNVRVLMSEVTQVLPAEKKVKTNVGEFDFDYLILACGAEHSYFGHSNWEEFAPGLKTLEQATEIRRRVLIAFEKAEAQSDPALRRAELTFVIVGGGPTGVELAGALGEITRFTLTKDFRNIDPSIARVILIEAGPRILAGFHPELSHQAMRDLEGLGVQVWCNSRVQDITPEGVKLGEEFVQAKTVIWAAGVQPSPLNAQLGAELDSQGRVKVQSDLSLNQFPSIFVVGDQAHVVQKNSQALPGLAPVAMQEGRFVGRQILRDLKKKSREAFHYIDKGQMATIGRRKAVGEIRSLKFVGFIAWCLWLVIHIYYLIGFKNRIFVLWQWTYSYFTYRRGARLITDTEWQTETQR